jgi:hypothetical protein
MPGSLAGGRTRRLATGSSAAPPARSGSASRHIGTPSFLADLGHEVPAALLSSLLTATLHAPAPALGLIAGIADAAARTARLAGGALGDDPGRRGLDGLESMIAAVGRGLQPASTRTCSRN